MGKPVWIVGAGLAGISAARALAEAGRDVWLFEKREHIAGNCYDRYDKSGILIHEYGPHIFHTKHKHVLSFLERFASLRPYEHKVLGAVADSLVPIPFNFRSIEICFPEETAKRYIKLLSENFPGEQQITISALKNGSDKDLHELSEYIYENVFLHYTEKQWNRSPEELGGNVMDRVPVRLSYDDSYFNDPHQFLPEGGYTAMAERMIDHPNIHLLLNHDACDLIKLEEQQCYGSNLRIEGNIFKGDLIFTGCIDEWLNYRHGVLPYRSIDFRHSEVPWPNQPAAVVNYPSAKQPFTRISEFAHFMPENNDLKFSSILHEFPKEATVSDIPCYPIPIRENEKLHERYKEDLSSFGNVHLLGRLANYRYMNMDEVIASALDLCENLSPTLGEK